MICRHASRAAAAVEVGAGAGGGGRGIVVLLGRGRHHADTLAGDPKFVGDQLPELGIEPLPHLGAAGRYLDGAVGVDVYQCIGLIEELRGERDAELDRRERDPLEVRGARRVEQLDLSATRVVVGRLRELIDCLRKDVVAYDLTVMSDVATRVAVAVQIDSTNLECIDSQLSGDLLQAVFDDRDPLGTAKTAKRRVGWQVRATDLPRHPHLRHVVGVVGVKHRAFQDRRREIGKRPAVGVEIELGGEQPTRCIERDAVVGLVLVAFAGDPHVVESREHQPRWPPRAMRHHRRHHGGDRRLGLFATKPAPHAGAFANHLVHAESERLGDDDLGLGGILCRREDAEFAPVPAGRGRLAFRSRTAPAPWSGTARRACGVRHRMRLRTPRRRPRHGSPSVAWGR